MEIDGLQWRKAAASNGNGACVELAPWQGEVLMRDSKDPRGPVLRFTKSEIAAWLDGAKGGEFDDLL